ncbi:MAG TPA: penicillin-binding transpeptidase domain-containing protein [Candidatus Polarisedimenticolia bacterium]|nr:penicillin-binding transpeptidase domain-containing protein [Candidatus Polarisedimenticolia bacterium]
MLVFDQLKKNDPQLRLLTAGVLVGLFVLLAGLWWIQIVSAQEFQQHLETQAYRTVRIPAIRGKIFDRNGQTLAENAPNYSVSLYLDDLRDDFSEEYKRLRPSNTVTTPAPFWRFWNRKPTVHTVRARMTKEQISALTWEARYDVASNVVAEIGERLQHPVSLDFRDFARHYQTKLALPYPVISDINPNLVARFEEQSTTSDGVDLEIQSSRYYPLQTTAAHLLGHLQRDDSSSEGEESYFRYRLPDYRGIVGIEYTLDPYLHGHAGGKSVLVNNQGYRQSENVWEPAEPGSNVVLTIDLRIQQAAEEALSNAPVTYEKPVRGAAVVMDVNTGDVLALASSPPFNPNFYVDRHNFPRDYYSRVIQAEGAEKNRATQENYAPGSIFKTIVGLACLEAGMDPNATIDNPGYIYVGRGSKIGDLAHPGLYDFKRAMSESSNVYFITNGLRYAHIEGIVKLGRRLHLGERIGLDNNQETPGSFPTLKQIHSHWWVGDTANLCIGQGYIAVTPLQMTIMDCALANGGKVLYPRFVDRIEPADPSEGRALVYPKGVARDYLGVSRHSLEVVRDAMHSEVEEGTGRLAQIPGFPICGKTGTAEIKDEHGRATGRTVWFLSYAPTDKPRWAVVVMVENGSFGGPTCAPAAKKIYEALLKAQQTPAPTRTLAGN